MLPVFHVLTLRLLPLSAVLQVLSTPPSPHILLLLLFFFPTPPHTLPNPPSPPLSLESSPYLKIPAGKTPGQYSARIPVKHLKVEEEERLNNVKDAEEFKARLVDNKYQGKTRYDERIIKL